MSGPFAKNVGGWLAAACVCLAWTAALRGQAPAPSSRAGAPVPPAAGGLVLPSTAGTPIVPPAVVPPGTGQGYILGPDDQISLSVLDLPELSDKVYRIDLNGNIKLPLFADRVQAAGLTVEQLEDKITGLLKTILKDPRVAISVVAFRSEPVYVMGSVRSPGVIQLQGRSTLLDIISAAGGFSDDAGYTLKIIRRSEYGRIPLPTAVDDASGEYSVAEVNTNDIVQATNPAHDILICPRDEITVPRGEMVYVIGTVARSGGYVLQQRATLSVLQILALAGGTDKGAAARSTKILRLDPAGGKRLKIPVNLSAILQGKAPDVGVQSGDILFVPSSASKKTLYRIGDVAASVAGLMIYRLP